MNIQQPTLIVDESRCRQNIARMVEKARSNNLRLRPHFKTHQSLEMGEWLRASGVTAITVSSVEMAKYFANAGWKEITIAFPFNVLRLDEVNQLAQSITINVLVDNLDAVLALKQQVKYIVNCYIEVDCGSNRSGLKPENKALIMGLAEAIEEAKNLNLLGFYTHAGHTYAANGKEDIKRIAERAMNKFLSVKDYLPESTLEFCWGDTPSCSTLQSFEGIDAISPGNFIFYDLMQTQIGSCKIDDIAVAMYCPIVSKKEGVFELCIHGGAIHFSKDHIFYEQDKIFGVGADIDHWQPIAGSYVRALSQEHGILKVDPLTFNRFKVGDVVAIYPVHSCLTAQAMGQYMTKTGSSIDHFAQKVNS